MEKVIFVITTLFIWNAFSMKAQVTIGSDSEPTPGAVLDLQSDGTQGLLMPQVTLTSAFLWAPVSGSAVNGMIVFNLSDATTNGLEGTGVYVWIKGSWRLLYFSAPCEGAIIKNGAYNGPDSYVPSLDGSFSAGWTDPAFSALNKDLCWNKQDASPSAMNKWEIHSACTGNWRLPNLQELQVLYEALGGDGNADSGINFGNLQSPHSNRGGADNMVSDYYWSSTEMDSVSMFIYIFDFNSGLRNGGRVNPFYVRCVRTL
jgi:hypothetical protein